MAGPVVAAAVILPPRFKHPLLNDSKQMTEANRNTLRTIIEERAVAWAVGFVWPTEIDEINILNASFLAMHRALDQLKTMPQLLIIDGNRFKKFKELPHECIIKGDSKFASIAAASVLAKTYRDEYMEQMHQQYPHYQWCTNKGYPTTVHRAAISLHGSCELHRKTFRLLPVPQQGVLFEVEVDTV